MIDIDELVVARLATHLDDDSRYRRPGGGGSGWPWRSYVAALLGLSVVSGMVTLLLMATVMPLLHGPWRMLLAFGWVVTLMVGSLRFGMRLGRRHRRRQRGR